MCTDAQEIRESNTSHVSGQGPTDPPSELDNEISTLPVHTDKINAIQIENETPTLPDPVLNLNEENEI